jgi:hypothetical protein
MKVDPARSPVHAGLSLPVEEAAQENVQMGRGKHHQGCESAAGHRVGIQRIGCGHAKRLHCTSRESSCSRPIAGRGWAVGMKSVVQGHRSSPSAQAPCLGREKT